MPGPRLRPPPLRSPEEPPLRSPEAIHACNGLEPNGLDDPEAWCAANDVTLRCNMQPLITRPLRQHYKGQMMECVRFLKYGLCHSMCTLAHQEIPETYARRDKWDVCWRHRAGRCLEGDNCNRSHDPDASPLIAQKSFCRHYLRGGCRYGDFCKYAHEGRQKDLASCARAVRTV